MNDHYPLARKSGIMMISWLLTAAGVWQRLTRAQRQALTVEAGSPRPVATLEAAGLWSAGGPTPWGRFVRDVSLRQLDASRWSVDDEGNLQMRADPAGDTPESHGRS